MTKHTTQSFIPVKDVRDGIIIRDDGVLCSIVLVNSLNFELKSFDERSAILYQFQTLLNSLEMKIQILVQSRKLNISTYIKYLANLEKAQTAELLKLQTREYINFIKDFTDKRDIMSKEFYVVVEYSPAEISGDKFSSFFKKQSTTSKGYEEHRAQLLQRTSFLQNNIRSLGLRAVSLGTEEVTEILYKTFNPGESQIIPNV